MGAFSAAAFRSYAFQADSFTVSGSVAAAVVARGGGFTKRPDRLKGKRKYWRPEDVYSPEELQAQINAIEALRERDRAAKLRKAIVPVPVKQAPLAVAAIDPDEDDEMAIIMMALNL